MMQYIRLGKLGTPPSLDSTGPRAPPRAEAGVLAGPGLSNDGGVSSTIRIYRTPIYSRLERVFVALQGARGSRHVCN